MLVRARRCAVLAVVALASAACSIGGSSEETSVAETTETTTVGERAAAPSVPTCQLISPEEVSNTLGVAVAQLEQAPTPSRCEFTSPERKPVLGIQVERGQTVESVAARIEASGDTVERVRLASREVTWSPSRSIAATLEDDAFVQVVLPDSALAPAERRGRALALVERVVARLAAFLPEPTFDIAGRSYVDNIIVRSDAGEWSLEEGVLSTLQLLAGDADEAAVLRTSELETFETTGVLAMAREIANGAGDPAIRTQVSELLDRLSFTRSELDAMARTGTRASAEAEPSQAQRRPAAAFQTSADCDDFYGEYAVPAGVGTCLLVHTQTTGGVEFRIYEPDLAAADTGWNDAFVAPAVTLVRETIDETVEQTFLPLGSLPAEMLVVLAASKHHRAAMQAVPGEDGGSCTVTVFLGSQAFAPSDFQQLLAHEFAHCFQNATFPSQQVEYKERRWREEGLAGYLSAVAYPSTNEERRFVDLLRATDIETATVFSRAYDNVVWFHFLRDSLGSDAAILDLVRDGPTSGTVDDQQAYLASRPEIEERHHAFALATTDGTVRDLDGSTYPPATAYNSQGEVLAEGLRLTAMFRPFGVGRFVITVPKGRATNIDIVSGSDATVSARPFAAPGDWFPLTSGEELLAPCDEDASFVVVASSAADETSFTMEVATLEEYDCDECVVGEWRLELPEPFVTATNPFLRQPGILGRSISGVVDLSIFDDGSIEVDIDGYDEVLEFDLYELRTTSRGRATGRWEIEGNQLRAGYEFSGLETTFATTGVGFSGTQNVPPIHTLISRPGAYTCNEGRLVYANPDGPIVTYRRR